MAYSINRAATPYLNQVGNSKTPVFILDNFLENLTETLLQDAKHLAFDDAPTYYPGIRSPLPEDYIVTVAKAVVPLLQKIYSIPMHYTVEFYDSYFSMVTKAPHELSVEQQIPHFDGTEAYRIALLHYLNPAPHGGTALFRHNSTGLERITENNVNAYLSSVSEYFEHKGSPQGEYISSSNSQFTRIGEIPYAQNRLAIYPGNLLHSGVINPAMDISPDLDTGRLTANIFLNFKPD